MTDLDVSVSVEEESNVVLVVGEYQIRVQLLRATRDDLAASRARRLMTERQVRLTREAALNRYRELSGLIRMY